MKVVLSLGGSLVYQQGVGINVEYLKNFRNLIEGVQGRIGLSVGGGRIAREYYEKGKLLGANNFELDEIMMQLVKANSRIVSAALPSSVYFEDYDEAAKYFLSHEKALIVLGVTSPGQTSDTTSALFAEKVEADRWVNLTNVDGVYDKDPFIYNDAKKFNYLTHEQLLALAEENDKRNPGQNFVIDLLAAKILARSKIEAHVVDGFDLDEVRKAILGQEHSGTVIKS